MLLALFLGALDQTIVATALPRIVQDLRGLDRYAWVATAYLLATTELIAVLLFLAGSFLCGLSGAVPLLSVLGDGMSQLIVFRVIQGLVGAVFGVASVLGPLAGGFLTDFAGGIIPGIEGWHWVFYVNLPFGAVALWFIAAWVITLFIPEIPLRRGSAPGAAAAGG